MQAGINKQYLQIGGMPIVGRTIAVFEEMPFVDDIYVITPEQEIAYCRTEVVERYGFTKVRAIVPGGKERQNSVLNGLRAIDGTEESAIILIHDGVRPFITRHILEHAVARASEFDGALVAVPAKDTIKIVHDGIVTETPQRETIWLAQTPQAFRYGVIRAAHEIADAEGFLGTDDASLVERMGCKIHIVLGDYRNIKITTPEDLVLAEGFLRQYPQISQIDAD